MWGHSEEVAIYWPGREVSLEIKPASTLILDVQPAELWENNLLLFNPLSLCGISLWQPEATNIDIFIYEEAEIQRDEVT